MPVFFQKNGFQSYNKHLPKTMGSPKYSPKITQNSIKTSPKSLKKSLPQKRGSNRLAPPEIEPQWLPELAPNLFARADPTKLSKRCGSQPLG